MHMQLWFTQTENIRIAYIPEIPSGTSTVHFRLTVPEEQYKLGPLQLKNFKATGEQATAPHPILNISMP